MCCRDVYSFWHEILTHFVLKTTNMSRDRQLCKSWNMTAEKPQIVPLLSTWREYTAIDLFTFKFSKNSLATQYQWLETPSFLAKTKHFPDLELYTHISFYLNTLEFLKNIQFFVFPSNEKKRSETMRKYVRALEKYVDVGSWQPLFCVEIFSWYATYEAFCVWFYMTILTPEGNKIIPNVYFRTYTK